IATGCKPIVYAPTSANVIPINVEKTTSFIYVNERIIDGCIATTAVKTATIPNSSPHVSVTNMDNATANPVFIIRGPILKFTHIILPISLSDGSFFPQITSSFYYNVFARKYYNNTLLVFRLSL